ncbi:MAG: galactokinase [Gemmatimonadota bacterium]|jgi:galactokinase
MSERQAAAERALAAFHDAFGGDPDTAARAPGRTNLIGEHVDYNDGFVLPVAVDRDVVVAVRRRRERRFQVRAADVDDGASFHLDEASRPGRWPRWVSYVLGVAKVLDHSGLRLPGADLAFAGDVPQGAGLSSSAALEVATARALIALTGADVPDLEVVEVCHRAEQQWAGVNCGVMDQFTSVFGRAGQAIYLDCRTLDCIGVPIPENAVLVAADSGVRHTLGESAYNERVRECDEAAYRLGVRKLRDIGYDEYFARIEELPELVRMRSRHVVTEIERTREAAAALEAGDLVRLGNAMNDSHESLRLDYEVSTPELDALVHAARGVPGVHGSRLSGAGFGGCTISLVDADAVPSFMVHVPAEYERLTGRETVLHVLTPAEGASVLDV